MNLVYGANHIFAPWICAQLNIANPGLCQTIGIVRDDKIIGGALYNNFRINSSGKPLCIEMSLATIDKSWASRGRIASLLAYPFQQLRVPRVQLTIAKRNKSVRRFVERIGFTLEGIARKAHDDGTDAAVYSLLWYENKWSIKNGQRFSPVSTSSPRSQRHICGADQEQQGNRTL